MNLTTESLKRMLIDTLESSSDPNSEALCDVLRSDSFESDRILAQWIAKAASLQAASVNPVHGDLDTLNRLFDIECERFDEHWSVLLSWGPKFSALEGVIDSPWFEVSHEDFSEVHPTWDMDEEPPSWRLLEFALQNPERSLVVFMAHGCEDIKCSLRRLISLENLLSDIGARLEFGVFECEDPRPIMAEIGKAIPCLP